MVINPGTQPVEAAAAGNIEAFAEVFPQRGIELSGPATRDPSSDRDGHYGYIVSTSSRNVRILMPGADLALVRDDKTASAPCLFINDQAWWWPDAVGQAAGAINAAA